MDLRASSLGFYRAWYAGLGARLGLFTRLRRPLAPEALARATGLDAGALAAWCRGAEALELLERRGERYQLRREHLTTLGDPTHVDDLSQHFAYITRKSLHFGALDDLMRGKPTSPDLADVYALATRWDHLAFVERLLPREKALLAGLRRGLDVLDLGAGKGHLTRLLAARFPRSRIAATDFDLAPLADVPHVATDAVPAEAFDVVLLGEVLAAAPDPVAPLAAAHRALRPGGRVVALEGLLPPAGKPARRWGERLVVAMSLDFALDGSRFLTRDEGTAAMRTAGFVRVRSRDLGGSLFALQGVRRA